MILVYLGLSEAAGITVQSEDETWLNVAVAKGEGRFDHYEVTCTDTEVRSTVQCQPNEVCNCTGLTSGEKYTITVRTIREGFQPKIATSQSEVVTCNYAP